MWIHEWAIWPYTNLQCLLDCRNFFFPSGRFYKCRGIGNEHPLLSESWPLSTEHKRFTYFKLKYRYPFFDFFLGKVRNNIIKTVCWGLVLKRNWPEDSLGFGGTVSASVLCVCSWDWQVASLSLWPSVRYRYGAEVGGARVDIDLLYSKVVSACEMYIVRRVEIVWISRILSLSSDNCYY